MYKNVFIIFIFLFFATPIFANDKNFCKDVSKIAETIMKKRQANVSIRLLMDVTENKKDSPFKNVVEKMIIEAYEFPLMMLDENKQTAIIKFGNKWYLNCVKKRL